MPTVEILTAGTVTLLGDLTQTQEYKQLNFFEYLKSKITYFSKLLIQHG